MTAPAALKAQVEDGGQHVEVEESKEAQEALNEQPDSPGYVVVFKAQAHAWQEQLTAFMCKYTLDRCLCSQGPRLFWG